MSIRILISTLMLLICPKLQILMAKVKSIWIWKKRDGLISFIKKVKIRQNRYFSSSTLYVNLQSTSLFQVRYSTWMIMNPTPCRQSIIWKRIRRISLYLIKFAIHFVIPSSQRRHPSWHVLIQSQTNHSTVFSAGPAGDSDSVQHGRRQVASHP